MSLERCKRCGEVEIGGACLCVRPRWRVIAISLLLILLGSWLSQTARAATPAETLLDCVCATSGDRAGCRERRRADVERTTAAVDSIVERAGAPRIVFAILLSTTCGESGAKAHPKGSNDAGTSAGWYQFKKRGGHARAFTREHGRALNPHDLGEATRWYLARLRNSRRVAKSVCGKVPDLWGVAAARVAAGVWAIRPEPASCVWALDHRASVEAQASVPVYHCTPAVEGVQRCAPRGYGFRARRWLKLWRRR